ncbi:hypothetical protein NM688_g7272 [Phlebia brevispora]|uniref:Uncharacterized protein n=1 Tax=Phlebia brevispora TaxID=194682 RepID=A0ACC1S788_9APHY|nr:hypothetical protein NM688_g7272 [Phlebia brevispora]
MCPAPEQSDVARTRAADEIVEGHGQTSLCSSEQHQRIHKYPEGQRKELQERLSSLSPFTRVPPEIISCIFEAYVADYWDQAISGNISKRKSTAGPEIPYRPYGWLTILHVCRDWRDVALCTPRIWTLVTPLHEECVNLALSSSGKCPLTIIIRPFLHDYSVLRPAYCAIMQQLPRIRAAGFNVTSDVQSLFSDIEQSSSLQPSMLQHLSLAIHDPASRLGVFSSGYMPQLQSLKIVGASSALTVSLGRPTLTMLDVEFSPAADAAELADLLLQLPLLEDLRLSNIDIFPTAALLSGPAEIPLPHLKTLSLCGEPPNLAMAILLRRLSFPTDTEIIYHSRASSLIQITDSGLTLPLIISSAVASNLAVIDNPSAMFHSHAIELRLDFGFSANLLAAPSGASDDYRTRLQLSLQDRKEESVGLLFAMQDLSELRYLYIAIPLGKDIWMDVLRNTAFPKLKKLCLAGGVNLVEFLDMLTTPLPSSTSSAASDSQADEEHAVPSTRFIFPNLKILELRGFVFRVQADLTHEGDLIERVIPCLRRMPVLRGNLLDELHITDPINLTLGEDLAALCDPCIARLATIDPSEVEDWGFSSVSEDSEDSDEAGFGEESESEDADEDADGNEDEDDSEGDEDFGEDMEGDGED